MRILKVNTVIVKYNCCIKLLIYNPLFKDSLKYNYLYFFLLKPIYKIVELWYNIYVVKEEYTVEKNNYTLKSLDNFIFDSFVQYLGVLDIKLYPEKPVSKITIFDNSGDIVLIQTVVDYLDFSDLIYSIFDFEIEDELFRISGKPDDYSLDITLKVDSKTIYNSIPEKIKSKLNPNSWTFAFINNSLEDLEIN